MNMPILSGPFGSLTVVVPTFTATVPAAALLEEDDEPEDAELPHAARTRARPAAAATAGKRLNGVLIGWPFWFKVISAIMPVLS
jgi:hypothetical protein